MTHPEPVMLAEYGMTREGWLTVAILCALYLLFRYFVWCGRSLRK